MGDNHRPKMRKRRSGKTRTYRGAILALALLSVALVVHEIYGEHGYLALHHQKREYDSLQREVRRLQEENQRLEKRIELLKSDPKTVESIARDQMGMARPGERIYTLPEEDKDPKSQDPTAPDENSKPQP
jgi:cell division protein FtsB